MSKRCAVKGCPTANPAEIKKRKLRGERPVSSFKVPQKAHRAEEWSTAIGATSPLTSHDFVCQLHFRNEDVITHFEQRMPDGTLFRKERERYMLREGASPIVVGTDTKEEPITLKYTKDESIELNSSDPIEARYLIITSPAIEHAYARAGNSDAVQEKESADIDNNKSHAEGNTENDDKCDGRDKEDDDPTPIYSLQLLKNDLKASQWRPNWIWSSNTEGIIFVHFTHSTMHRRIQALISNDLAITISLPDKSHDLKLEERVRDFQDVTDMLNALESLEVCSGTGHEEQKRSPDCARFLEDDELYAKNRGLQRCIPCRQLRHRLQKKTNKSKATEKDKKSLTNTKLQLLKKHHKALRRKGIIDRTG